MKGERLAALLLKWYDQNARDLPWRRRSDPYAVWVAETMLQQTRVETVIPYYERWMEVFPALERLAAASEQEVLSLWEGLGYYSRARNLHRAAQVVVRDLGGALPRDLKALRRLPGIGRYTAGAIASIAFGQAEPALDGNVRRVLARVFDVDVPARSPKGESRLWRLAAQHLPEGRAGDYNQALMDLGATTCTPRSPACSRCPLASICQARRRGVQELRPVATPRKAVPHHTVSAAVIFRAGKVLIAKRPPNGLLGGLWEFPGGKLESGEGFADGLRREIYEELGVAVFIKKPLGVYRHAFTHFKVTVHAYFCDLSKEARPRPIHADDLIWADPAELDAYPMGKVDRLISRDLLASLEHNQELEQINQMEGTK